MDTHLFAAFVAATAVMIALPGPSVLLTVAHSLTFGWRNALSTVGGATAGIAVQLIVAAVGLGSLLHVIAEAFEWLRWAGVIYLIYLGIRQWKSAGEPLEVYASNVSRSNLFLQGLTVTIPNPKSLIFIAAFLPQFLDTTRPVAMQFLIIVPTFLVITYSVTALWAVLAGNAHIFLKGNRSMEKGQKAAGGLMILAGIGLAMARRGN